jgi:hypothetical protein
MVLNDWSHCVSGVCPSSGILNYLENTTFRKLDLFPSSGEGRETPAVLCPLERSNLNHWTWKLAPSMGPNRVVAFLSHLKKKIAPVSKTLCGLAI